MNPRGEEVMWPSMDTCSECGRAVKLIFDIEDPLYTHVEPPMPDEPERCDPDDENLIATTRLRDQRAPTSRADRLGPNHWRAQHERT